MMKRFLLIVVAAVLLGLPAGLRAGIYLQIQSPTVQGESTVKGYEQWIIVNSFSSAFAASASGTGGGNVTVTPSPITISKLLDKSSPTLLLGCHNGQVYGTMTLTFTQFVDNKETKYYEVKLENVRITSVSQSSSGDRPGEALTLVFNKITWTYYPTTSTGNPGTPVTATWNYAGNPAQ